MGKKPPAVGKCPTSVSTFSLRPRAAPLILHLTAAYALKAWIYPWESRCLWSSVNVLVGYRGLAAGGVGIFSSDSLRG